MRNWMIWSNSSGAYWRENSAGYTDDIMQAGLYLRDVAERAQESTTGRNGTSKDRAVPPEKWMKIVKDRIAHRLTNISRLVTLTIPTAIQEHFEGMEIVGVTTTGEPIFQCNGNMYHFSVHDARVMVFDGGWKEYDPESVTGYKIHPFKAEILKASDPLIKNLLSASSPAKCLEFWTIGEVTSAMAFFMENSHLATANRTKILWHALETRKRELESGEEPTCRDQQGDLCRGIDPDGDDSEYRYGGRYGILCYGVNPNGDES